MPRKKVGADWPTRARPIATWSRSELRRTAESERRSGNATTSASTKADEPQLERRPQIGRATTSMAGWRKWIDRPKSPRSDVAEKHPVLHGRGTGRGRDRAAPAPSRLIGASGGKQERHRIARQAHHDEDHGRDEPERDEGAEEPVGEEAARGRAWAEAAGPGTAPRDRRATVGGARRAGASG